MKIAQVCHRFLPTIGGIQTHVNEISTRLVERGIDVEVLTTDPKGKYEKEESMNGIFVRRFKSFAPGNSLYFSSKLNEYLREHSSEYDIIHAHNYQALPALYAALNKKNNKMVFTPHYHEIKRSFVTNLFESTYRYFGRKIFQKSDKIICVSKYESEIIRKVFDISDEKITIIPNGLNRQEFIGVNKVSSDKRKILSIGKLYEMKGHQHIVNVMPLLEDDVILEIVGEGSYGNRLLDRINQLYLGDRVKITPYLERKELIQRYFDADLYMSMSELESYGITVAEALITGTPCIVNDNSALRDWVDDGSCYGISDPSNGVELAALVNELICKNVEGVKVLDWDDVVDMITDLYLRNL